MLEQAQEVVEVPDDVDFEEAASFDIAAFMAAQGFAVGGSEREEKPKQFLLKELEKEFALP